MTILFLNDSYLIATCVESFASALASASSNMSSNQSHIRPGLVVFDLDETLWPFSVEDYEYSPPYRKSGTRIVDSRGDEMRPYPEVPAVLKRLHEDNIEMAAASRTVTPNRAVSLINLLGWSEYLKLQEIYPGSKTTHFKSLQKRTGIPFEDMLFFDNESRNISDVSKLGVTCVLVNYRNGMTFKDLEKGYKALAEKRSKAVE